MKRKPESLFEPFIVDLVSGERRRMTRDELREANRLWWRHRDIREGGRHSGHPRQSVPPAEHFDAGETASSEAQLDEQFQTALELDDARDARRGAA